MGGPGVAFEVSSVNPFAGTALAAFTPNSQVAVGGYFSKNSSTGKLNWGFSASTSSVALGGMIGGAASFQASSATNTVQVDVSMAGFLGAASLKLDGIVSLTTGDFDLSQSLNVGMDLGIAQASVTEVFHFARKNGTTSIYVSMAAYVQLGDSTTNFHAGLSGTIYVSVDRSNHVTFAGSGTVYAGLTLAGSANDASVGFGFDNNGFNVTVLGYTLRHGW